jgi:hypothetical protein
MFVFALKLAGLILSVDDHSPPPIVAQNRDADILSPKYLQKLLRSGKLLFLDFWIG